MSPSSFYKRSSVLLLMLFGLTMQAMAAQSMANADIKMDFIPSDVAPAAITSLQIGLASGASSISFTVSALPSLPADLTYTGNSDTTCPGLSVSATPGGTSASATGTGTVSVTGGCTISLEVQAPIATVTHTYQVLLPEGAFFVVGDGIEQSSPAITAVLAVRPLSEVTVISNTFSLAISGGVLPTLNFNCGGATVSGTMPSFTVPSGSNCKITVSGAVAPASYTLSGTTFVSGTLIGAAGTFTVPDGGVSDIVVTTSLVPVIVSPPDTPPTEEPGTPEPPVVIPPVNAIEFYHSGLNHYFLSANLAEIDALDTGFFKGWERTGHSFPVYNQATEGVSPVCRFYLRPEAGDSHFYSASPQECQETAERFPDWILESPNVFYIALPNQVTGACPQGTKPVWRFFHEAATNHRYTTDPVIRDILRQTPGWIAEGYGPDAVIMCAPLPQ